MKLTLPWFLFYGRMLHMTRQEILITQYSEMVDMITCLSIYNGTLQPAATQTIYNFDAAMAVE